VFSTKNGANLIHEPEKLWRYMRGICHTVPINVLAIGGTSNHVYVLISVSPTKLVAHVIRDLGANSFRSLDKV